MALASRPCCHHGNAGLWQPCATSKLPYLPCLRVCHALVLEGLPPMWSSAGFSKCVLQVCEMHVSWGVACIETAAIHTEYPAPALQVHDPCDFICSLRSTLRPHLGWGEKSWPPKFAPLLRLYPGKSGWTQTMLVVVVLRLLGL